MTPAGQVQVAEQHLDLAANQQRLKGWVVNIDIADVDLFKLVFSPRATGLVRGQARQRGVHVLELPAHGQAEGPDRAFHALEQVHPHQVNQALFAVDLAEDAFAAPDGGAVLLVVGGELAFLHVAQRRVAGQLQAPDLQVDLLDRLEFAGSVDIGLDVDGRQAAGEAASLRSAVVLLDVPARARDGEVIEKGEVVEAQHLDQQRWRLLFLGQLKPAVESLLGAAGGAVDAGDAVIEQRRVITLGDERNLVLQVGQPVVHWRGRQHQYAGLHTFADDPPHQAVVPRLVTLLGGLLVSEVVRLVDHDQVVIAPVHVRQVDVARQSPIT